MIFTKLKRCLNRLYIDAVPSDHYWCFIEYNGFLPIISLDYWN